MGLSTGTSMLGRGASFMNALLSGIVDFIYDITSGTTTVSTVLSGNGSLTKTGAGILVLSGANTFTGGVNLNGGRLSLGSDTAMGTGTLAIAAGTTMSCTATRLTPNNNPVRWLGGWEFNSAGVSLNIGAGAVAMESNTVITNTSSSTPTLIVGGAITGAYNLTATNTTGGIITLASVNNTGTFTHSGDGTGVCNVTLLGANVTRIVQDASSNLNLNGNPSFTGPVEIKSGTVTANVGSVFNAANVITIGGPTGSPTLSITQSQTTAGINDGGYSNGIITTATATGRTFTINGSDTYSFGGNITAGSGGLIGITKAGTGTQTLSGTYSNAGTLTVSEGTLIFTGSKTAGNVSLTSGTFCGATASGASATVAGTVTVSNSTGTNLQPGSFGNNTLNTGALTFSGTSSRATFNSTTNTFSKINVTGTVALGGARFIFPAGITTNGTYDLIVASGTMSGTIPVVLTNNTGKTLVLSQVGNTLKVTVS